MRTLRFIVNGQIIEEDPSCDFDNLVPGTKEYLTAEFTFSPEWNGYAKVASFYSSMGKPFKPQVLKGGRSCTIPADALKKQSFKVQVYGRKNDSELVTNKVTITQDGGSR